MLSRTLVLASLLAAGGCDLGDVRDLGGADAAGTADDGDPDGGTGPLACTDPVANVGGGEHNPGQACIACHEIDDGPRFTLAGTLYDSAAGTAPIAGATILVTDAAGTTAELVTQANGNFWTSEPLVFPVQVSASRCPDTAPMVGAVAAPGDCNAGGCHAAGSATGRVHL